MICYLDLHDYNHLNYASLLIMDNVQVVLTTKSWLDIFVSSKVVFFTCLTEQTFTVKRDQNSWLKALNQLPSLSRILKMVFGPSLCVNGYQRYILVLCIQLPSSAYVVRELKKNWMTWWIQTPIVPNKYYFSVIRFISSNP